jgi:hypothetical protein
MSKPIINLSDSITSWITKANALVNDVGDQALLTTSQDSDVVGALNSLKTSDLTEDSAGGQYYTTTRFDSDFGDNTTNDLTEGGSNLYYTTSRFDSDFGDNTTNDLTEGATNRYYTTTRFDSDFGDNTTNDLTEGGSNLYYTTTRFDTAFNAKNTDDLTEGATNLYHTAADSDKLISLQASIDALGTISTIDEATVADYRTNTSSKALTTDIVWSSMAVVGLTDGATITPNFDNGIDFSVTIAGNRTLANPTNVQIGQRGRISIRQDGAGNRTLSYGSYWHFTDNGAAPVINTGASNYSYLYYDCVSSTTIVCAMMLDVI